MFDDKRLIELLWQDPVARTEGFFGKSPYHKITTRNVQAYQLGVYLSLWGELYGHREDPRVIAATGRGTGKTTVFQELNAADMACFMPYFLQVYYGTDKPVDVTIIFVANVKKGAKGRLEAVKQLITSNPFLERQLVDYKQWTKDYVILRNGASLHVEGASSRTRGYHSIHPKGKVIYLCDEFAFWGGIQCMDGQAFVEEIAEQSFGAVIGCFTTPYGQRGGAWWAYNHPNWLGFNFPTWMNPRTDKKKLAAKVKRLLNMGRQIIVDQEIRGLFVIDVGLFFSMQIWMKSLNHSLEWEFENQHDYRSVFRQLRTMNDQGIKKKSYYLFGHDPNMGTKKASSDPYGLCLIQKIGGKYYNRFCTAYNGKSQEEIAEIERLICKIYQPVKNNYDGGGGYATGSIAMVKGHDGVSNIFQIPGSNPSIVGFMTTLRSLMEMGRFEQPPDENLRESQLAMKSIGDVEEMDNILEASIKFQTDKKQFGIPCDLAAMGLAIARENVSRQEIAMGAEAKTDTGIPKNQIESRRVNISLQKVGDMGLGELGILPTLTKAGI